MSNREVVTIHTGQAGAQVSTACWELFCFEHGIQPDGFFHKTYQPYDNSHNMFFMLSEAGKLIPRTVVIDLEPTVIDKIRIGPYRQLFKPESLITGKEDAANNFAKGYYRYDPKIMELALDSIRKMCENCSNLDGFFLSRSCAGGTGSGFAISLLQYLKQEYEKKSKFDFIIHTAPNISSVIVEPYNAVLSTHFGDDYEDCCFIIDNEALYDICVRNLQVPRPMFMNLNRLQAQAISNITAPMRFRDDRGVNLDELQTNLIPQQRIHFAFVSYAPIVSSVGMMYKSPNEFTSDCFHSDNYLAKCDPSRGIYMSCCLLYRGYINIGSILQQIVSLKNKPTIHFVDWSPTPFKVAHSTRPVTTIRGGDLAPSNFTVTCLSNNTVIKDTWSRLIRDKFEPMYEKRTFIHHYLNEGMEESHFEDAQQNIYNLIDGYKEIEAR